MHHISQIFQEKLAQDYDMESGVDRKLRRQIDEKKEAQGFIMLKSERLLKEFEVSIR